MDDDRIFPDEFVPNIQGSQYHPRWVKANPGENTKWVGYRDKVLAHKKGNPAVAVPTMATKYGKALVAAGDLHVSVIDLGAADVVAPATPHVTGVHWAEAPSYDLLGSLGYEFVVSNVAPGDMSSIAGKLDAATAAGMKMVTGLYGFGGPEPYVRSGENWTLTSAAIQTLNYMESREDEIIAFFGFNEPYWEMGLSSQALRNFRATIEAVWPTVKIVHDIGIPSGWAPGGPYSTGKPNPNAWADQSGMCTYVGYYYYPFYNGGYYKDSNLVGLRTETAFVQDEMGATPMWLAQAHSTADNVASWPTQAQMLDWNCAIRAELPPEALISWYVWSQEIYTNDLSRNQNYVPMTLASACS